MPKRVLSIRRWFRAGALAGVPALLLSAAAAAAAFAADSPRACPELADWDRARTAWLGMPPTSSLAAASDLAEAERAARLRAARAVYLAYFNGSLAGARWEACLETHPGRGDFANTLQSVFYDESLAELRTSRRPAIRALVAALDARSRDGRIPIFRLTGHFREQSPTELKGGYHRGTGSLFVDFSRVPPSEWLLILVHELLHSLDEELAQGIRDYADPAKVAAFTSAFDAAAPAASARSSLDAWLAAGLSRGLWAEWRAWVPTFAIYEEGRSDGLWPEIGWMETVRAARRTDESPAAFVYRYLDERSPMPDASGIFARPAVREALTELRGRYASGRELPPRGNLGAIGAW